MARLRDGAAGNQAVNSSMDCGFGVQPIRFVVESLLVWREPSWVGLFLAKVTPFRNRVEHKAAFKGPFWWDFRECGRIGCSKCANSA